MPGIKPRIAVSSCLLGNPVRYDGSDKYHAFICEYLAQQFELIAVCPEVGLGTPRPPVRLTGNAQQILALGVEDPKLDVTAALISFAHEWLSQAKNIDGIILKSRSPSCGLSDTPIFDQQGQIQRQGSGLFTQILIQCYPQLPVIDEIGITDPKQRDAFISKIKNLPPSEHLKF